MGGRTGTSDAGRVAALRRRIERWRRTRQGFAWMPEELWADAVALARVEGAYAIARDLGLSYASLRTRLARTTRPARRRRAQAAGPGFVEVGGDELLAALGAGGSVVAVTRRDGAQLTVRLAGAQVLDVVALSAAFVGGRR